MKRILLVLLIMSTANIYASGTGKRAAQKTSFWWRASQSAKGAAKGGGVPASAGYAAGIAAAGAAGAGIAASTYKQGDYEYALEEVNLPPKFSMDGPVENKKKAIIKRKKERVVKPPVGAEKNPAIEYIEKEEIIIRPPKFTMEELDEPEQPEYIRVKIPRKKAIKIYTQEELNARMPSVSKEFERRANEGKETLPQYVILE